MKKKPEKLIFTCPYCGTILGRTVSMENAEITCIQCRKILLINCKNSVLTVREGLAEYAANINRGTENAIQFK